MGQLILINEGLQKGNVIGEKADEQSDDASNPRGHITDQMLVSRSATAEVGL